MNRVPVLKGEGMVTLMIFPYVYVPHESLQKFITANIWVSGLLLV